MAPDPLDELTELLEFATPEQKRLAAELMGKKALLASPAQMAAQITAGDPGDRFVIRPHIAYLDRHIVDVAEERIKKLLVTFPPRHGKSELTSRYTPPWFLAKYPSKRVILTSYEADFAATWGRKSRDVIEQHDLGVKVRQTSKAAERWDLAGYTGGMMTAGAGGPITGKGAHLFIIDDPHKDAAEANSPTVREKVWDWYRGTVRTRLEPQGGMILIQTRWHESDLAGHLLAEEGTVDEGGQWTLVNLPALAEAGDPLGRAEGEALWPERYDAEALGQIRADQGNYFFSALYQQRPQPAEGGLFKREGFKYWTPRFEGETEHYDLSDGRQVRASDCWRFLTVDLAVSKRTTADFTVMACWAATPDARLVLLDRIRARLEGPDHLDMLRSMNVKWQPRYCGIERATYGISLIQSAQREGIVCRELRPDKDKIARALVGSALCERGHVYFPRDAAWLGEWEHEMLSFPSGAHDDQVDCLAYAANEVTSGIVRMRRPPKPEPVTLQERMWASFDRKRKKKGRYHPELGRM